MNTYLLFIPAPPKAPTTTVLR